MSKEKFNRGTVNASSLKRITISLDFKGLTNIDGFIERLKMGICRTYFNLYSRLPFNGMKVPNNQVDILFYRLRIPFQEIKQIVLHSFTSFNGNEGGDVRLEVTRYTLALIISPNQNYLQIDPYIKIVNLLVSELCSYDTYVEFSRISIEKFDVFLFDSTKSLRQYLEGTVVFSDEVQDKMWNLQRQYEDRFLDEDISSLVNYRRDLREVTTTTGETMFQVILSFDIYKDEELINSSKISLPDNTSEILHCLNNKSFELFRRSVTEKYLEENVRK
ncbi:MAG: TIGR04255 family protein [Muribaculum sp.]|nr:TIGR04255 family protein [Muribaculum sp.]